MSKVIVSPSSERAKNIKVNKNAWEKLKHNLINRSNNNKSNKNLKVYKPTSI